MRCLYVTRHGDSALIRSLTESGFMLRVIPPSDAKWARTEGPYSVVVFECSASDRTHFIDVVAGHGAGTAVLAVLVEDSDKLRAELLRAGVDYCLSKPVSVFEVEAVLHSFFRRKQVPTEALPVAESNPLAQGLLTLNSRSRQVTCLGKPLPLSEKEIALLQLLMRSVGAAIDRQTLWREVWQESAEFNPQAIDLAISRLRRKLQACPVTITNLRNYGYKIAGNFEVL